MTDYDVGHGILFASAFEDDAPHFSFNTSASALVSRLPTTSLTATLDLTCFSSPFAIRLNSGVARLSVKSAACTLGWDTIMYVSVGHVSNCGMITWLIEAEETRLSWVGMRSLERNQ